MQPWITQFNSNKLQRRRLESTQFHSSNSSGEEDCLCISVPAEVEKKKKKKLEKSKPVVVEEKDNLHNSIPAPAEKMTKLHDMIPAAMERKIICIIHGLFTILEIQHLLSIPSHAAYHHALSSIHGLVLN
jgi:hypothetical protein